MFSVTYTYIDSLYGVIEFHEEIGDVMTAKLDLIGVDAPL